MGLIVYWSGKTGNTAKFVESLAMPAHRIGNHDEPVGMALPFVLVTPTYADGQGRGAIPKPVTRFMSEPRNRGLILGVIGGGNRNFGSTFAAGATAVSINYGVPVLYRFELCGMPQDTKLVQEGLQRLWTAQQQQMRLAA